MPARSICRLVMVAALLVAATGVTAADLGTYRGFTLGASTTDVLAHAGAAPRDLRMLHERPARLEELTWRPPYVASRESRDRDSVAGIVFSFVDGRLFKIAVEYDRGRTAGLTKDDLIAVLSGLYGPPSTRPEPATGRPASDSITASTVVARWRGNDTTIVLHETPYHGGFGLVLTSTPLDSLARKAAAQAMIMDAREAPAREAARVRAQDEAARAAAEATRTTNKATFQP